MTAELFFHSERGDVKVYKQKEFVFILSSARQLQSLEAEGSTAIMKSHIYTQDWLKWPIRYGVSNKLAMLYYTHRVVGYTRLNLHRLFFAR